MRRPENEGDGGRERIEKEIDEIVLDLSMSTTSY